MSNANELIDTDLQLTMRSIIQRIATGPELSKDISQQVHSAVADLDEIKDVREVTRPFTV